MQRKIFLVQIQNYHILHLHAKITNSHMNIFLKLKIKNVVIM